jgi:hypothetical protein
VANGIHHHGYHAGHVVDLRGKGGKNTDEQAAGPNMAATSSSIAVHEHGKGGKNMAATSSGIAVHEHGKGGTNTDEQAEPESDSEEMGSASPPSMTAAEVAAVEAQWATAVIDGGDDDLMDYMLGD